MIQIKNMIKRYPSKTISVNEIIIKDVLVLKGKNGAGKSTLLKAIKGLIKYKGSIKGTCFLLNQTDFPSRFTGKDISWLYGIENNYKRLRSLSKGQMQKLKLDVAFTFDNILLDEPLDGLDESVKQELVLPKKTILIATHSDYFDHYDSIRM